MRNGENGCDGGERGEEDTGRLVDGGRRDEVGLDVLRQRRVPGGRLLGGKLLRKGQNQLFEV